VLTGLLFGGNALIELSKKPEFSTRPKYDATLMTPMFSITPSTSIDEFLEDSAELFENARKEIDEE
jgi:hypothetical protein